VRCRPITHELVITHAQCAWVSDQCALTMLHPLPTRAGDRTPFEQSGQVCAFLSPPPPPPHTHTHTPHLLPHLCLHAAWAPPPTAMPHAPPSSDVEADAPQSQAAVATPGQNVARTDGCKSVPTQVLLVDVCGGRSLRACVSREGRATTHKQPTREQDPEYKEFTLRNEHNGRGDRVSPIKDILI